MPQVPHHIAIVMDGNGRWASKSLLPRVAGHKLGVDVLGRCIRSCAERGVAVLTVFAFSSENWKRPEAEITGLMDLMVLALSREVPQLKAAGVRIHFVGELSGLSDKVRRGMLASEQETAANSRLILNVCFNYGGRWDITQATARLVASGQAVTEQALTETMALAHVPDPDLLIRTGGEMRLSNFVLWQAAYTELYFSDKLWPEFDATELDRAITAFNQRERRFGKTSAQLQVASTVAKTDPQDALC